VPVSDGRGHVSHRELALKFAPRLIEAIEDYHVVEELVHAMLNPLNRVGIRLMSPELLRNIVDYALAGQGILVIASVERRLHVRVTDCSLVGASLEKQRAGTGDGNDEEDRNGDIGKRFRICARIRPLLSFEEEQGAYDATGEVYV
jgi:hypothetical protein